MKVEIKVPSPGESITEVQIARWIKKDGDYVERDEEIAEIDSDKATLSLVAEADGVLKTLVGEGENIAVGSVVCTIDTDAKPVAKAEPKKEEKPKEEKPKEVKPTVTVASAKAEGYAAGTPSVAAAKMMKENNVKSESVQATGKGGRITKGDVLQSLQTPAATQAAPQAREQRREKMTMLRKKLSQRLVAVKQETAMLTTFNEVDMSAIMDIRKKYKDVFKEKHGVGLGFMSFFTKAVCEALKSFPAVNAQIDGEEILYHNYCDVGIAVSAPKGLMVPIIRSAETLSLAQIEQQVIDLATKARDSKLTIDEMTGGTFTITNGGVFGSMLSTPIINPPQSAILGMHNIVERPVAVNGEVVIRPVMYVALSYDHRIIDGRESVGFLVKVKQMLEEPAKMLFEGNDPIKVLLHL
ncbi:MAG TPA: 2-oxoglutarate dehydrogenase complex dihydrolipoyllysine-residue succinyltransferase [Bacteroidia bacterium]|nr:2-oxoglutarate dehydrogenase complex dihydrolipoyllysine-residue succinyltransferase [Bacteroidia bacterium]MBP7713471.1 2-oxoglutarate dehydrogenase complex dihydrolipoyllysine-residue succinyltransferase [Bacteroidia bacterium]MBP8667313.1 2-oxoglutarate dehydrogenase complex dihydrolipoyllysine-residue succinyltransferase [Bacteroidia bacterium]HOZ82624.1 2-oxoglutarate dehydrogenase complex dihydrolipoyllysine-residue succinyltransferase [Bacteroidia bacterium]HOZ90169.1 2-oxoglutarate d